MSRGWFVGSAARASPVRLRHFRRAGGRQGEGAAAGDGERPGRGLRGGLFPLPTIREGGGVVVDASADSAAVGLRGMRGAMAVPDPQATARSGVHRCPGVADTAPVGVPGPSMRRPTPHPIRSTPHTVPRLAALTRTTQRVAAPQPRPWRGQVGAPLAGGPQLSVGGVSSSGSVSSGCRARFMASMSTKIRLAQNCSTESRRPGLSAGPRARAKAVPAPRARRSSTNAISGTPGFADEVPGPFSWLRPALARQPPQSVDTHRSHGSIDGNRDGNPGLPEHPPTINSHGTWIIATSAI